MGSVRVTGDTHGALVPLRQTMLDRVISAVSPTWGVRRLAARIQEAQATRFATTLGYVAGSSERKSLQEWNPVGGEANDEYLFAQNTIRARSRDLTKNSALGAGASNTATTNVIGTGIRLHSRIDSDYLGLDEAATQDAQRQLERIWRMVKNRLDYEGDATQAVLQSIAFRGAFESGDILVVRRRDMRAGDLIPLKVQLVESDRVSNPNDRMDSNTLAGGVETQNGVVVAYHVADRHPGEILSWTGPTRWTRVPKAGRGGVPLSMLLFDKRRPGQRRGVPALAPVIEPIKQIARLTEYELTASVVSSLLTVFVKTEQPQTGGLPAAPEGTSSENQPTNTGDVFLNPGAIVDLLPGEDIQTVNPNRPNGAYDPFFRSIVQQIGMGLEIPYEQLMHLYQSSYSASRAALLDAWRFFKGRRTWMAENFLQIVYEWVVMDAVADGLIALPGFMTDPMARAAWLGASWVGDAPGAINEMDAARAATIRIDAGLSDRATETAALSGRDWDSEVQPQRAAEKRRLEADEMPFAATVQQGSDGTAPAPQPANDGQGANAA